MISAWSCEHRLVLGQLAVEAKSNEITAIPKLLRMLSPQGCTVTVDALNCQREIARPLNLLRKESSKGSLRNKFHRAAWSNAFLLKILAQV